MSKPSLMPPRHRPNGDLPAGGMGSARRSRRGLSPVAGALVALVTIVVLLAGVWVFGAELAPDGTAGGIDNAILATVAWLVVASVILGRIRGWRPELRWPLRGAFLAVAVGLLVVQYLGSRDKSVSETVVTAPEPAAPAAQAPATAEEEPTPAPARQNRLLARGELVSGVHMGKGTARAIERASGGRVLTLTGFETDAGPDLFLYLVDGDPDPGSDGIGDHVNLGGLKGNRGNQQYTIPKDVDLRRFDTVLVWCRAFSVNFTQARLTAR